MKEAILSQQQMKIISPSLTLYFECTLKAPFKNIKNNFEGWRKKIKKN